ncbi:gliding motility-associated C-terminal domain-containing protein [Maribacter sp. HTCC2170]|uniref:gliding motility-associated C-terminal domain-containing protein n=1 Tax=Maribacter sp. (strain HTCC2170 / KCCM 42371) TaxID=313603 RepID=UPI000326626B|nr:gliding motility-associated C-terminal domain-containing protein [Maribacter sp. HTCC2170]
MNTRIYILGIGFLSTLFCSQKNNAQEAVHNFGTIQLHNTAAVGFHIDLINNGSFDQNLGLVGFYGEEESIKISGAFTPIFYDTEIAVDNGLFLDTAIGAINNVNLISGNIITPRDYTSVFSNFLDEAFYVGENAISLVDGYAAITNKESFTFPIGTNQRLRPLTIDSYGVNAQAKCAYFDEDPNSPSTFGKIFETQKKGTEYLKVSSEEFWHLEGEMPSKVTLTWDEWSNVGTLGEYLNNLKVVGWSKEQGKWINLGNSHVDGGMNYGKITSEAFVPNDYEIITIGGNDDELEEFSTMDLGNYFLTPNGDGQNDYLVLDGIKESPSNQIQIFNRYGVLVYSKSNYENDFNGVSNSKFVIDKGSSLTSGIYFYMIKLNDVRQKHQGYLYLIYNQ